MENKKSKISIKDVSRIFFSPSGERIEALKGVNLEVEDAFSSAGRDIGEFRVLLGPSGCGKSTLLRMIAGLDKPTSGQVLVNGEVVTHPGKDRGMVFQKYTSFPWLTVADNIAYGMKINGVPEAQRKETVDRLLKSVGLAALIHFWLASTSLVLYTLFFVVTWQFIGFGIVLLLAGLQGIPPELREAAAIDGASSWQITRRIMLPLLGPTIRIWIFLAVIGSLQLFDIVWIMTLGGPANASQTMLTYLYFNGAERTQFGYGATVSVVLFIISFVFALAYQRYALRRDTAGALTRAVG